MRIRPLLSTMPPMQKALPAFEPDETIILQDQGGYRPPLSLGWRVADLILTTQRFLFCHAGRIVFQVPLKDIRDLRQERHYYVLRKRQAIGILYHGSGSKRSGLVWFIVNNWQIWKGRLFQVALLKVDEKVIKIIASRLDDASQAILLYLWEKRHARIDELAKVCGADTHMAVLTHIRDTINPVAAKEIGCPVLSFERSRKDPETGEKIAFSWWMLGKTQKWVPAKERLMDIFDEGDHFLLIMEVSRVEKSDLKISVDGKEMMVQSLKTGSKWQETFTFPEPVILEAHGVYLKNSLLEITLQKGKK